jgi:hypothetical protein
VRLNEIGDPRRGDAPCALAEPPDAVAFDAPALVVLGVRRGDLAPTRFALALVEALVAASRPVVVHVLRRADGAFEADASVPTQLSSTPSCERGPSRTTGRSVSWSAPTSLRAPTRARWSR